jgi:hypothetical protein
MPMVTLGEYASTRYPCELGAVEDMRRGTYVLGTQGSGKSTLPTQRPHRHPGTPPAYEPTQEKVALRV